MRKRSALTKPAAKSELEQLTDTSFGSELHCGEGWRGHTDTRWRFRYIKQVATFEVAVQCKCGRWWGWKAESEALEFKQTLKEEGCVFCR